jgi:hypothetical protein
MVPHGKQKKPNPGQAIGLIMQPQNTQGDQLMLLGYKLDWLSSFTLPNYRHLHAGYQSKPS